MRTRTRILLGLALAATASIPALPALMAASETEAARKVKADYARQVARIQSLDVTYKLETRSPLPAEKLLAIPEYMNQLFLPNETWRVAFKGDKRLTVQTEPERVQYLQPQDRYGLTPPVEPPADAPEPITANQKLLREQYERAVATAKQAEARGALTKAPAAGVRPLRDRIKTRGFNGRTLWLKTPATADSDRYEIWSGSSRPNWFQVTDYLSAVGLYLPDPRGEEKVRKAQAMFAVADWLRDGSYDLEPATEVVDGSTCVVLKGSLNSLLEPGFLMGDLTDRIWLDRDHGLVLRKREQARDGKVGIRWTTRDLKEVEPGLWLPLSTTREQFSDKAPPEIRDRPVMIVETRVETIQVNRVPDDLFDMVPAKNDAIDDLRARF
ncbi:hypothetical protein OJF2_19660 [Aquisphaera giovannonii]|uniref:MucB/RseB N-terminal domain-containing protein n=1 Tax=Aquisphaera giovannonii TaxID=406548 RepID=A0A5B9VZT7_9BACT|nr:hypothetical protein [Aquisphaera giovannonii]QEH33464.1 hypothetical protein OJF2_19660 [Aquisphaera giovannonii]